MKNFTLFFLFFSYLWNRTRTDFWLVPIQYGNYRDISYGMSAPSHSITFVNILNGKTERKTYYNEGIS